MAQIRTSMAATRVQPNSSSIAFTIRGDSNPVTPIMSRADIGPGDANNADSGDRSAQAQRGNARDLDLEAVVAAWPDLPPALRAGIVAMVKAAGRPAGGAAALV
jgi:hypothetical protein